MEMSNESQRVQEALETVVREFAAEGDALLQKIVDALDNERANGNTAELRLHIAEGESTLSVVVIDEVSVDLTELAEGPDDAESAVDEAQSAA